ncbi:MAG: 16S rRNA (uracil(1498)-N(3))-methyltransferase [Planctomycetia bacterium]|nr:16S rRNA (uracil(1498)-N(3))-methyltransferase [Planctomycetia bacterium]
MSERFFLSSPPHAGRAVLEGDEARHLVRVLRGKVGDLVRVFDGSGVEWPARVMAIGRDEVTLELDEPLSVAVAAAPPLTLAVALPKGDRQKWLVEKLTELGVARLVPLVTLRGVAEATPGALERLRRGVLEACKQSGRNTLMEIGEPRTIAEILRERPATVRMLVADPGAAPLDAADAAATAAIALVGPEGGFAAEELAALDAAGVVRVGLGPHILRVETAAIALAARLA